MTMWTETNNSLPAELVFASFADAMTFMVAASYIIERHNHHPDWYNVYNRVSITLRTHDAGDIVTGKDKALAAELTSLYENHFT